MCQPPSDGRNTATSARNRRRNRPRPVCRREPHPSRSHEVAVVRSEADEPFTGGQAENARSVFRSPSKSAAIGMSQAVPTDTTPNSVW
jgi:hypothetical protein